MKRAGGVLGMGAAVYLAAVVACSSPYAGGADSSGYLNFARLLLAGEWTETGRQIAGLAAPEWTFWRQQPLGFEADRATGELTPTYPVGLPLHLAAVGSLVGLERASIVVNVFFVIASGMLMVGTARRLGLSDGWATLCAGLLWASPIYFLNTLQPMSDLAATVWVLAAIYFALRAREDYRAGLAAGAAVAMAVLVRPANAIVMLPIAVVLGARIRAWVALVAGGLPGGIFWGWVNATLYGGVLRTGYGDVSWYFGWSFAGPNALHFAKWLPVLLSPPVVLAALGLPWVPSAPAPIRLLLATWFGAFAGFYVFYSFSGMEWWYLRFLLPAFPAVILAGALVARVLLARIESDRTRGTVGAALLAVMAIWNVRVGDAHNVSHIARSDEAYKLTADWLQEELPGNAIVLVSQLSGAMTYYTDFALIRWDTIEDEATWAKVRGAAAAAKRPIYAALYDFEIERAFTSDYVPGKWERVAQIRQMSVWRLHD